jgi:Asp-tRNA(Asn)/Glu-tRNA(Gln) amidotransferase C subunit
MELKDLKQTAALARLGLSEQELQAILPDFEQMLLLIDLMQTDDQSSNTISKLSSERIVSSDFFRRDKDDSISCERFTDRILTQAGERDGCFIVIPNVL